MPFLSTATLPFLGLKQMCGGRIWPPHQGPPRPRESIIGIFTQTLRALSASPFRLLCLRPPIAPCTFRPWTLRMLTETPPAQSSVGTYDPPPLRHKRSRAALQPQCCSWPNLHEASSKARSFVRQNPEPVFHATIIRTSAVDLLPAAWSSDDLQSSCTTLFRPYANS
jgi:hypothetical protein